MAKLIIEGDKKQLEAIANRSRLAVTKYGLKLSLTEESKKQEEPKPSPVPKDLGKEKTKKKKN